MTKDAHPKSGSLIYIQINEPKAAVNASSFFSIHKWKLLMIGNIIEQLCHVCIICPVFYRPILNRWIWST